jgi:hypothetical protein
MGVDWSASVIAGIRLGTVYTETHVVREVTRYDSKTEKPRQVNEKRVARTFLGKELADLEYETPSWGGIPTLERDWNFLPAGLEVFGYDRPEKAIVGVEVEGSDVDEYRGTTELDQEALRSAQTHATILLAAAGYTGKVMTFVRLHGG